MSRILIGYGTTEGQAARIAEHLAKAIGSDGVEARVADLKRSGNVDLDSCGAVIIGGSIHMGKRCEPA